MTEPEAPASLPILTPESQPETPPVPSASAVPVSKPKTGFIKKDEADIKSVSFTGRATADEAKRLNTALKARQGNRPHYDIVRLALDMMNYIEKDFLQTFKTK